MFDDEQLLYLLSAFGASGCSVSAMDDPCVITDCGPGTCVVTAGRTSMCSCPAGSSGANCEINPDDCLNHACVNGACVDDLGMYTCSCTAGFTGGLCDTALQPPATVFAELSFDIALDDMVDSDQFDRMISADIARALQIPRSSIVILSKSQGSVIVTFAIMADGNYDAAAQAFPFDPATKLVELSAMIRDSTSRLYSRGRFIDTDRLKPAHNRAVTALPDSATASMQCTYHMASLATCNGKAGKAAFCGDMSCQLAMQNVMAWAGNCASVAEFPTSLPSWGSLCDYKVPPTATFACPNNITGVDLLSTGFSTGFALTVDIDTTDSLVEGDARVTLVGDAYVVPGFGAHFDGHGDALTLDVGNNYGNSFSISMWFTKAVCHIDGVWEALYFHSTTADVSEFFRTDDGTKSGILMGIGCSSQGTFSSAGGDLLRTHLKDDLGNHVKFDWQLGCAGSGSFLSDTWIHFVLGVQPDSVRVYADGVEQMDFGYPVSGWPRPSNAANIGNPAYPAPSSLSTPLGNIATTGLATVGALSASADFAGFGFVGRMAYLQVFPDMMSETDATCIFSHETIATCDDVTLALTKSFDYPLTAEDAAVTLTGEAAYHSEFGLKFDGAGDYATVSTTGEDFTADMSFTISFWASQTLCMANGIWENLYLHYASDATTTLSPFDATTGGVSIQMVCFGSTPTIMAQVKTGGPTSQNAGVQVSATDDVVRQGGTGTSNWVAFGLSVSPLSLELYIDGMLIPLKDDSFGRWGWMATPGVVADSVNSNMANPIPAYFNNAMAPFATPLTGLPILLGGDISSTAASGGNFEGSIIALSIFSERLDPHQHDCLYQQMEATVATCDDTPGSIFQWTAGQDPPEDTYLRGDTHPNGKWGLTFDGDEDHVTIKGGATDFADDGTFAISMWFTKPVCNVPGDWQFLFSQLKDRNMPVAFPGNSGVNIFIGCGGWNEVSTVSGDIVRIYLTDTTGTHAVVDVKLDGAGGPVTDTWTHLVVNVHKGPDKAWDYAAVPQKMSYQDAEAYCVANFNNGHLISIHNDEQQEDANKMCADASPEKSCWIGLNDYDNEGTFVWTDGSARDYDHFSPGEPNDYGAGEDGVLLWHRDSDPRFGPNSETWNDGGGQKAFLCEQSGGRRGGVGRRLQTGGRGARRLQTDGRGGTGGTTAGRGATAVTADGRGTGQRGEGAFGSGAGGNANCGVGGDSPRRFGGGGTDGFRGRFGDRQIDNGGVEVFVNGQKLPDADYGYPLTQVRRVPAGLSGGWVGGDAARAAVFLGGGDSLDMYENLQDTFNDRAAEGAGDAAGRRLQVTVAGDHCSWDGSCTSAVANTEGAAAGCHRSSAMCSGPCTGNGQFSTTWCPAGGGGGGGGGGGNVVCPGHPDGEYCDGNGDCGGTDYCNCPAGVALCSSNSNAVASVAGSQCESGGQCVSGTCLRPTDAMGECATPPAPPARPPFNIAENNPNNFTRPMGGFSASERYTNRRSYMIPLDGIGPGEHTMTGVGGSSFGRANGWHGGWFEILDRNGNRVAGGEVDGLVDGESMSVDFTVTERGMMNGCRCATDCTNRGTSSRGRDYTLDSYRCSVNEPAQCEGFDLRDDRQGGMRRTCSVDGWMVAIHTMGQARDITWMIDDGEDFSGPRKTSIHIGGRVGRIDGDNFFVGSIAGIAINRRPLAAHDVECMYLQGEETIGRCSPARGIVFSEPLLDDVPATPPVTSVPESTITMFGQTYLDPDYGAVMDGVNDYLTYTDTGFTSGNYFTISFWFTRRTECVTNGKWEFLYSEAAHPEVAFFAMPEAAIEIYLGCGVSGADDSGRDGNRWNQHEGDVVRTYAQDSCGSTALFDIPIFAIENGGVVTGEWTHYMLSISSRSIGVFINGETVVTDRFLFAEDGFARSWIRDDTRNIAYPDPSSLNNRGFTCDFGLSEVYGARDATNIPLDDLLTTGTTYTINYEAGAEGTLWIGTVAGRTSCAGTAVDGTMADGTACAYAAAQPATCTGTMADGTTPCAISEDRREYGAYACSDTAFTFDPAGYTEACTPDSDATRVCACTYTAAVDATCGAEPCAINAGNVLAPTEVVNRQAGSASFTYTTGVDTWLSITNGAPQWDSAAVIASQVRWSMTDGTSEVASGPATGTTYIGGRSDRTDDHYFMGSMAGLEVRATPIDSDEAICSFQSNERLLGTCDMDNSAVAHSLFSGENLGRVPRWGVTMVGNAHTEDDYGVTLSGDEDFVKIETDDNDWAATGRFALSFWFTKAVCHVPGDYEVLFSQHADADGWTGCRHGDDGTCSSCNPGIEIYLGCFSDGTDGYTATSTISGDVIRTMITDDSCQTATFDTPLNKVEGGYLTDQWVHFALSVWGRGAHTYVDGTSIEPMETGYPMVEPGGRAERWW